MEELIDSPRFAEKWRRLLTWAKVGINTLLLVVLAGEAVFLGYRWYIRWDVTENAAFSVSDTTVRKLQALEKPVRVTVFYSREYPPHQWAWQRIYDLLEEMQLHTDKLDVIYLDPYRKMSEAEQLRQKYGISPNDFSDGVVVFEYEDKVRYLTDSKLIQRSGPVAAQGPGADQGKRVFNGEEAFLATIVSLVEEKKPVVYFLMGHGEADLESPQQPTGFYQAGLLLQRDGFEVKMLRFQAGTPKIPGDADLVIVAAPQSPLAREEVHALRKYAEEYGTLMVLPTLQYPQGGTSPIDLNLEPLLEFFGIRLSDKTIVDEPLGNLSPEAVQILTITQYNTKHPSVKALGEGEAKPTYFMVVRGVYPEGKHAEPVAVSSRTSVEKGDITEILDQRRFEDLLRYQRSIFNPEKDKRGPFPVVTVSEIQGKRPGESARIVVAGTHYFASNFGLSRWAFNRDLFMNLVNWLVSRESHMGIGAKRPSEVTYKVSPGTLLNVRLIVLLFMPLSALAVGVVMWLFRRQ